MIADTVLAIAKVVTAVSYVALVAAVVLLGNPKW